MAAGFEVCLDDLWWPTMARIEAALGPTQRVLPSNALVLAVPRQCTKQPRHCVAQQWPDRGSSR